MTHLSHDYPDYVKGRITRPLANVLALSLLLVGSWVAAGVVIGIIAGVAWIVSAAIVRALS